MSTLNVSTINYVEPNPNITITPKSGGALAPSVDNSYDLGTSSLRWKNIYATSITVSGNQSDAFPSGTTLVFYQSFTPPGWSAVTDQTNKALRVVSGAPGNSGGTASATGSSFTSVFTSQTITLPQHSHTYSSMSVVNNGTHRHSIWTGNSTNTTNHTAIFVRDLDNREYRSSDNINDHNFLSDAGDHSHTVSFNIDNQGTANAAMNLAVQYIDVILCRKN